jgi:hypothetical protein
MKDCRGIGRVFKVEVCVTGPVPNVVLGSQSRTCERAQRRRRLRILPAHTPSRGRPRESDDFLYHASPRRQHGRGVYEQSRQQPAASGGAARAQLIGPNLVILFTTASTTPFEFFSNSTQLERQPERSQVLCRRQIICG